jgi:hypothetical protein
MLMTLSVLKTKRRNSRRSDFAEEHNRCELALEGHDARPVAPAVRLEASSGQCNCVTKTT